LIETLMGYLHTLFAFLKDINGLIEAVGYAGIVFIVFAETGLLIGFFLPGDSLLLASGLFALKSDWNVWALGAALSFAAILGDAVGFAIGRNAGPLLYERKETFFFRRSHLLKAKQFYDDHGGKTIILARFIPIVRTFAPTVAGVAGMNYKHFAAFNIVGGLAWVWSFLLAGYFLGKVVPNLDKNLHYIVLGVIVVSVVPIAVKVLKDMRRSSTKSH
jgi:membrane-associated protein